MKGWKAINPATELKIRIENSAVEVSGDAIRAIRLTNVSHSWAGRKVWPPYNAPGRKPLIGRSEKMCEWAEGNKGNKTVAIIDLIESQLPDTTASSVSNY